MGTDEDIKTENYRKRDKHVLYTLKMLGTIIC